MLEKQRWRKKPVAALCNKFNNFNKTLILKIRLQSHKKCFNIASSFSIFISVNYYVIDRTNTRICIVIVSFVNQQIAYNKAAVTNCIFYKYIIIY